MPPATPPEHPHLEHTRRVWIYSLAIATAVVAVFAVIYLLQRPGDDAGTLTNLPERIISPQNVRDFVGVVTEVAPGALTVEHWITTDDGQYEQQIVTVTTDAQTVFQREKETLAGLTYASAAASDIADNAKIHVFTTTNAFGQERVTASRIDLLSSSQ